jgi:hypothetical protein
MTRGALVGLIAALAACGSGEQGAGSGGMSAEEHARMQAGASSGTAAPQRDRCTSHRRRRRRSA